LKETSFENFKFVNEGGKLEMNVHGLSSGKKEEKNPYGRPPQAAGIEEPRIDHQNVKSVASEKALDAALKAAAARLVRTPQTKQRIRLIFFFFFFFFSLFLFKTVVHFFCPWYPPSHKMAAAVARLSSKYGNVQFLRLDAEALPQVAGSERYRVTGMPYFIFFKKQSIEDRMETDSEVFFPPFQKTVFCVFPDGFERSDWSRRFCACVDALLWRREDRDSETRPMSKPVRNVCKVFFCFVDRHVQARTPRLRRCRQWAFLRSRPRKALLQAATTWSEPQRICSIIPNKKELRLLVLELLLVVLLLLLLRQIQMSLICTMRSAIDARSKFEELAGSAKVALILICVAAAIRSASCGTTRSTTLTDTIRSWKWKKSLLAF
jgi:thiol-disulfide isomerase/thioredoxin